MFRNCAQKNEDPPHYKKRKSIKISFMSVKTRGSEFIEKKHDKTAESRQCKTVYCRIQIYPCPRKHAACITLEKICGFYNNTVTVLNLYKCKSEEYYVEREQIQCSLDYIIDSVILF